MWSIRVDVRALDDDGNLADACAIAALCSLLHFRKADVEVQGDRAKVHSAEDRVPVPLSVHHLPVPVTCALYTASPKGGKSVEAAWILDPNRLEEAAMDGALCVAVNQHGELCGLHKPGGMPLEFSRIAQCVELAVARAKEITGRIKTELEADAEVRKAARRNVHQQFAKEQMLTVDTVKPAAGAPAIGRDNVPPPSSPVKRGWKSRRREAPAAASVGNQDASMAQGVDVSPGAADELELADDGRDIEAELEAVALETAELEKQLAAAESAELAAAAEAGVALRPAEVSCAGTPTARKDRKKRRAK